MKALVRLNDRLASTLNHRVFLLRCRKEEIFPPHLDHYFRQITSTCKFNKKYDQDFSNATTRCKKAILNIEIKNCIDNISNINKDILYNLEKLSAVVPEDVIVKFKEDTLKHFNASHSQKKNSQVKKFNTILNQKNYTNPIGNMDWFINLTDKDIPKEIKQFLSLGPQFSVPVDSRDFPVDQFICDVELYITKNIKEDKREEVRGKCVNMITNQLHKHTTKHRPSEITKLYHKTKKFLRTQPDIIITKTDKSNQTVAIDRNEYIRKVSNLLNDPETYKIIKKNPTKRKETTMNNILATLLTKKYIDKYTHDKLFTKTSTIAKLYAVVKTHKEGNPVRPIVSYVSDPTYETSKYLANILKNISNSKYNIKDSFEFKRKISEVRIPENYELISLDASSLFTNLPLPLIKQIISNKWEKLKNYTNIPKTHFMKLLDLCTTEGCFQFNNIMYTQNFGCPMGSPCAPVLADLCLEYLLDEVIPKLPFQIPFLFKYVDDHLLAVPRNSLHLILTKFNNFHPRLQFTYEGENERNSIPFLDLLIIRNPNGSLSTKWYQKPQHKGRFIHFHSYVPYHQKTNFALNMIDRSKKLSSPQFHKECENRIVDLLLLNGYPHKLICKLLKHKKPDNPPDPNPQPTYYSLPYVNNLSENLNKLLTKDNKDKKFAYKKPKPMSSLFSHTKDPVPKEMKSHLIYEIPCECEKSYFGHTISHLKTRVYAHKRSIDNIKSNPNQHDPTALATHSRLGHNFKLDDTKIIDFERNWFKSEIKEMVNIERNFHRAINKRTDVNNLSKCYGNLIHMKKRPPNSAISNRKLPYLPVD